MVNVLTPYALWTDPTGDIFWIWSPEKIYFLTITPLFWHDFADEAANQRNITDSYSENGAAGEKF